MKQKLKLNHSYWECTLYLLKTVEDRNAEHSTVFRVENLHHKNGKSLISSPEDHLWGNCFTQQTPYQFTV